MKKYLVLFLGIFFLLVLPPSISQAHEDKSNNTVAAQLPDADPTFIYFASFMLGVPLLTGIAIFLIARFDRR